MNNRWFGVAGIAAIIGLGWSGQWLYGSQLEHGRLRAQERLLAIAKLKVDQIAAWRKERIGDGELLRVNRPLTDVLIRWLNTAVDPPPTEWSVYFAALKQQYGYIDAVLVDADGHPHADPAAPAAGFLDPDAIAALAKAWETRQSILSEVHADARHSFPHLSLVTPLFQGHVPAGSVILIVDARESLFPLIQSWPVPSATAESLMVRRDGDDVLFLNELRYRQGASLAMRMPLTRTELPAVQAVMGRTGLIDGLDYRGVPLAAGGQGGRRGNLRTRQAGGSPAGGVVVGRPGAVRRLGGLVRAAPRAHPGTEAASGRG